jgi:hypothetical protein
VDLGKLSSALPLMQHQRSTSIVNAWYHSSNAIWICRYICIAKMGLCHTHRFICTLQWETSWGVGSENICSRCLYIAVKNTGSTGTSEASKPIVKQQHLINWIDPPILAQRFFSGLPSLFERKKHLLVLILVGTRLIFADLLRRICTHQSWTPVPPTQELELPLLQMQYYKMWGVVVRECSVLSSTWYGSSAVRPSLPLYQQYDCSRAVAFCPNPTNLSANTDGLLAHMPRRAKNCAITQIQRE